MQRGVGPSPFAAFSVFGLKLHFGGRISLDGSVAGGIFWAQTEAQELNFVLVSGVWVDREVVEERLDVFWLRKWVDSTRASASSPSLVGGLACDFFCYWW